MGITQDEMRPPGMPREKSWVIWTPLEGPIVQSGPVVSAKLLMMFPSYGACGRARFGGAEGHAALGSPRGALLRQ